MGFKILKSRNIILFPIVLAILLISKLFYEYIESQNRIEDFVQKQAQSLNHFMIVHRNYYQDLYVNNIIPLNEKTLVGLPAFSASDISENFSNQNHFDIKVQTVSDKARNEKNQANNNELKAIEYFKNNPNSKEYFLDTEKYFLYATALFIEQKCLVCHGKKEDAPKFIQEKYKNAYDYKLGELRGIVSIQIPKEKIGSYFNLRLIQDILFDLLLVVIFFMVAFYLIRYFKTLSDDLQQEVNKKTKDLSDNIAFLKSYQIAMNESSIVTKADLEGNITYANENFLQITGYTKEEILGKPHNIVRHPDNPKELFQEIWQTIKAKKVWKGILKNKGKNKDYWVDTVILPILDNRQNIVEYIAVRHDITKMIEQKQILDNAANTDSLTGFGSRYKLNQDIEHGINPALAILNIDSFSQINDFYGHKNGDFVIIILHSYIEEKSCELYHLQGDEYVIYSKNIATDEFIQNIINITSKVSTTPIKIEEENIYINFTAAISFENKDKLLVTADMALKIAKRENKNFVIYDESISLNDEYKNNIKWAKKIKDAIKSDNIIPVFQAIVNNQNGAWEKYESLVRLKDEDKLVTPYFFLDISKKTKHYTQITQIMIEKSFEKFKDKNIDFSINLTIEDILDDEIQKFIFLMLQKYQNGSRVVFEIVESESINNFDDVFEFIKNAKAYGVKIAIDDFGTGYSNFEYLMKLDADFIKIDGSLIKEITTNTNAQIVVSIIVDFAKKMNIKTIAEFVENETIFNKVKELGIDYSQGYYFSLPKEDIQTLN